MPGIDVHTHLVPSEILAASAAGGQAPQALGNPAALVRHLDDAGLERALVSAPPPFYGVGLPANARRDWVRALNDGLSSMTRQSGGRLLPLAYIPLSDPRFAADEAARCLVGGFAGLTMATSSRDSTLADPELEPLWEALDATAVFVLVHPVDPPDPRLRDFHLANLVGFPCETALAAACLLFSGTLARRGRIRFCLAHAGGAVPALAGRWQRAYETGRTGGVQLELEPREALRRLYADSLAYSESVLRLALETFGGEHILLGSDWPFLLGEARPLDGMVPELRTPIAVETVDEACIWCCCGCGGGQQL